MRPRLALVAVLGLVAAGCGGSESEVPFLPQGRAIDSSRSLTPTTHFFGDIVTARVEVRIDRRLLDPAKLRVEADFKPYELVGEVERHRRDLDDYTRLRYEYALRCLTLGCIPEQLQTELGAQEGARGERRTLRFPPAQIRYDDPSGEFPGVLRTVSWPPVTSVSRLNEAQSEAEFPFRATPEALPGPSYLAAPALVVGGLLLVGLALLTWPVRLGVRAWRERRPPVVEEEEAPSLTPLERVLLLVEWARERPDGDDRRRTLEVLADELERTGAATLSDQASELAWSRDAPSPEAVSALLERVREDDGLPARA
jgi:hypothetical protein